MHGHEDQFLDFDTFSKASEVQRILADLGIYEEVIKIIEEDGDVLQLKPEMNRFVFRNFKGVCQACKAHADCHSELVIREMIIAWVTLKTFMQWGRRDPPFHKLK